MIVFAYDGSLHGDWVAHYALRFSANVGVPLRLVHVATTELAHLPDRLGRIEAEARRLGVELAVDVVTGVDDVAAALLARSAGATLVTGTRARPRHHSLLANTVSARLLARAQAPMVAIHVVHPGLLGQPGRVLVAGVGPEDPAPLPVLSMLGDELHALHVMLVHAVSRLRLPSAHDARWIDEGRSRLLAIEGRLRAALPHPFELDGSVVVSSDPPREVRLRALAHRSRLVVLDAALGAPTLEAILTATPADVAIVRGGP